jgi:hypothetical protein
MQVVFGYMVIEHSGEWTIAVQVSPILHTVVHCNGI